MAAMIAQRAMGVQAKPAARTAPRAIPALKSMPLRPAAKQVGAGGGVRAILRHWGVVRGRAAAAVPCCCRQWWC